VVAAGYDNGDVKFFDLKKQMFIWDTNLKNGVCGIEFDRKDIIMNKLGAATLEGKFTLFDMRTFNPTTGYASLTESAQKATLWGIKQLLFGESNIYLKTEMFSLLWEEMEL